MEEAENFKEAVRQSMQFNRWLGKNMAVLAHRKAIQAVWSSKSSDWRNRVRGFNGYIASLHRDTSEN